MLILSIRTDKPEAEVALYENERQIAKSRWLAHRQLSVTLHSQIEAMLKKSKKDWHSLGGIFCFEGPGSFTGLRIGLSVANALANSLKVPIVGASGPKWADQAINKLQNKQNSEIVLPKYGEPAKTTTPKNHSATN